MKREYFTIVHFFRLFFFTRERILYMYTLVSLMAIHNKWHFDRKFNHHSLQLQFANTYSFTNFFAASLCIGFIVVVFSAFVSARLFICTRTHTYTIVHAHICNVFIIVPNMRSKLPFNANIQNLRSPVYLYVYIGKKARAHFVQHNNIKKMKWNL